MRAILLVSTLLLLPALAVAQVPAHVYVPPVRVTVAPPAVKAELRPVAPSARHVWLGGHWAWRDRRHVWIPGQWALPPAVGYTWVEPRWVPEKRQWVYYEGYWATPVAPAPAVVYEPPPPPPQVIVATVAPPAPIVEVRPAVPFAGAVWIPGYWHWTGGQYVWLAGRWSAPSPHSHWVPAQWRRHGHEWHFVPGHWKRR